MQCSFAQELCGVIQSMGPVSMHPARLLANFQSRESGEITLGDIMEILPFEDPIIVLDMDGKSIWDALENALSKWPAQEG
jgi:2',3'-cyclic-nucleotide 2'-phosphodiesterase (5'-nucleotidase family)